MNDLSLAIDLGGTKLLLGVVDREGNILASRRYPSPLAEGKQQHEIASIMLDCIDDFSSKAPMDGVKHLGAGVVGRVHHFIGIIDHFFSEIIRGETAFVKIHRFFQKLRHLRVGKSGHLIEFGIQIYLVAHKSGQRSVQGDGKNAGDENAIYDALLLTGSENLVEL